MRTRPATAPRSATCWPRGGPAGGAGGSRSCTTSSKGEAVSRAGDLAEGAKKLPRILTVSETQAILDACTRLRDRFFFALLYESGCRAGEALGLRHEDIAAAEREITIVARENANGATGQVRRPDGPRRAGADPAVCRLPARGVRRSDSGYVFVNIWAEPKGHAWSYQAAYDLVLRLRARTGIAFRSPLVPARSLCLMTVSRLVPGPFASCDFRLRRVVSCFYRSGS